MNELKKYQVLIIEDREVAASMTRNLAVDSLASELEARGVAVKRAYSYVEAMPLAVNDMDIDAFLISSDMELNKAEEHCARRLIGRIDERHGKTPIFLLADREKTSQRLSGELMNLVDEFVWIFEDSPVFIAGRVEAAIARYRDSLLPPMMKAMWLYNEQNHEYSYAAPGHQGGVGFTKCPVGKKFYDFYGENLFRTDTGIERSSIGSLLDHSGAFGDGEKLAAKVFGSDQSYSVVVGTSGSNRTVMQGMLKTGDVALCDRNCHKSIEQGLILTGAIPVYMKPTRNRYGIIGPILRAEMTGEAVKAKLAESPFNIAKKKVAYTVVTNCTYDGLCYNAAKIEPILEKTSDVIHWDEAWYAYARFNPLYTDHFAMRGDPAARKSGGPTIFATHSTHKLLNALSQASYIHVRSGRHPVDFDRFNQAYMMHATTSPLYAICASNDISSAMMRDCGESLTGEVIAEAVDFRQAVARLEREFNKKGSWFFHVWNAPKYRGGKNGKPCDFADAPREELIHDQSFWRLDPKDNWHGFDGLEDDWVMIDPIKVSILGPGMGDDGKLLKSGVPATLVSSYLYNEGIVPTRTTDFQLMFLFSTGITKGKWGTLLNALLNFKKFYDANVPVSDIFPQLVADHPERYGKLGVKDLCDQMFDYIRKNTPGEKLNAAFGVIPKQDMTPRQAYEKIVSGDVELVPADKLAGRTAANSVIPYPPGIPLLMSGENFGAADSPQIGYLKTLTAYDRMFPGFDHVTEGASVIDGVYNVLCVKK